MTDPLGGFILQLDCAAAQPNTQAQGGLTRPGGNSAMGVHQALNLTSSFARTPNAAIGR